MPNGEVANKYYLAEYPKAKVIIACKGYKPKLKYIHDIVSNPFIGWSKGIDIGFYTTYFSEN